MTSIAKLSREVGHNPARSATSIARLPDDLWARTWVIGRYGAPLGPNPKQTRTYNQVAEVQQTASDELYCALTTGTVEELGTALGHVAVAWDKDVLGKPIKRSVNWVSVDAARLAREIDAWLDELKNAAARKEAA